MEITTLLVTTAKALKISPALLVAICTVESTDLKNVYVHNDKGTPSYGACQIKQATAHFMGNVFNHKILKQASDQDLKEVKNNIKVAGLYLKYQLNRYNNDWCKAVAAYNAGSFKESRKKPGQPVNYNYVKKVMSNLESKEEFSSCDQMVRLAKDDMT